MLGRITLASGHSRAAIVGYNACVEDELVSVASYGDRLNAELARGLLEIEGIASMISADDAGGMRPPLQLTQGVRLFVRAREVERAREVLDFNASDID